MLISALGTFTTLLVELLLLFLVISYAVALINRRFGPERLQSWMAGGAVPGQVKGDRKSTRLNSSHVAISYAVFCLKKKTSGFRPTKPTDGVVILLSNPAPETRLAQATD